MLSKGCWEGKKALRLITFPTFICGISSSTDFMFLYVSVWCRLWVICVRSWRKTKGCLLSSQQQQAHKHRMMPGYLQPSRCPASLVLPRHDAAADAPTHTLNLLCGSLDRPPPGLLSTSLISLLFPTPSGSPGSLCQRLAPGQPVSRPAPQAAYIPLRRRTLPKPGDSSRLVWLLLYLTASQLASDDKKKK